MAAAEQALDKAYALLTAQLQPHIKHFVKSQVGHARRRDLDEIQRLHGVIDELRQKELHCPECACCFSIRQQDEAEREAAKPKPKYVAATFSEMPKAVG
jgi:hypothetical protein